MALVSKSTENNLEDKTSDNIHYEADLNRQLAEKQHDIETAFGEKATQHAVDSAQQVVRALVLVNGAAGIAVLAFLGNHLSVGSDFQSELHNIAVMPMIWFSRGVVIAVLGIVLSYLTNYSIAESSTLKARTYAFPYLEETAKSKCWKNIAKCTHVAAILAVLFSVGCFVKGFETTANIITIL
ncbi:MAG: hypothetical protein F4223_04660 [Rhodobacteraceae bacterium]|nr:hypothetical protein [Paracoccaceae bacterium]